MTVRRAIWFKRCLCSVLPKSPFRNSWWSPRQDHSFMQKRQACHSWVVPEPSPWDTVMDWDLVREKKVFVWAIPFSKAGRLLLAGELVFVFLDSFPGSWESILVTHKRGLLFLATSPVQLWTKRPAKTPRVKFSLLGHWLAVQSVLFVLLRALRESQLFQGKWPFSLVVTILIIEGLS